MATKARRNIEESSIKQLIITIKKFLRTSNKEFNTKTRQNNHDYIMFSNYAKQAPFDSRMSSAVKALIVCVLALTFSAINIQCARMVRLCIASVDPVKLSSQCVMCNRREFPLTAIDCTGITKMNDLISNPLSVQEATCLIFNCRRQVPDIKPEPYHGSVSHAARANYAAASGTRSYGMMPPSGMFGGFSGYPSIPSMPRYNDYASSLQNDVALTAPSSLSSAAGLVGNPNIMAARQQALPYALVPTSYTSPFGSRKYKAALVPLFKR